MQQQQRQPPPQYHQQQQSPAVNPFIPLQASRKATKSKGNQSDTKKVPVQKEAVQPKEAVKVAKAPVEAQVASEPKANTSQPAVDNGTRKCRLAISFGKA